MTGYANIAQNGGMDVFWHWFCICVGAVTAIACVFVAIGTFIAWAEGESGNTRWRVGLTLFIALVLITAALAGVIATTPG